MPIQRFQLLGIETPGMRLMKFFLPNTLLAVVVTLACFAPSVSAEDEKAIEPLKLNLPNHTLKGTPEDLPAGPNIEPPSDKPPPPLPVPKGVVNVAAGKVTLDRLWHAVPAFPTVSEVWLRLLEAYGL